MTPHRWLVLIASATFPSSLFPGQAGFLGDLASQPSDALSPWETLATQGTFFYKAVKPLGCRTEHWSYFLLISFFFVIIFYNFFMMHSVSKSVI